MSMMSLAEPSSNSSTRGGPPRPLSGLAAFRTCRERGICLRRLKNEFQLPNLNVVSGAWSFRPSRAAPDGSRSADGGGGDGGVAGGEERGAEEFDRGADCRAGWPAEWSASGAG